MSKSVPITQVEIDKINSLLSLDPIDTTCISKSTIPLQCDGDFTHHHYTQDDKQDFKLILAKKNTMTTLTVLFLETEALDLEMFATVVQTATSVLQRCGFRLKSKNSAQTNLVQASVMVETNNASTVQWVVQTEERTQELSLNDGRYESATPVIFLTGCPNTLETNEGNVVLRLSRFFQMRNAKNQLYKDQGLTYSLVLAVKFFLPSHHFELVKETSS